MRIGIMSDSHGDTAMTSRAVSLLLGHGAERLVHCGDLCDVRVLDELAGRDAVFVWGNCDDPNPTMRRYVEAIGLAWPTTPMLMNAEEKRIAVFHGHEREFNAAARTARFDYVLYGHTHQLADHRHNGCRFINPGALHRAAIHSVALLDTSRDQLKFYSVDDGTPVKP